MSDTPKSGEQKSPEQAAACETVFAVYRREMELSGSPTAVRYLKTILRVVPDEVQPQGSYKRVSCRVQQRLSDYTVRYNGETGEQMSWYCSALRAGSSDQMTREEGLEISRQVAQPPQDAVLESAFYEEADGQPVFLVRWSHLVQGIPVERDQIQILINGHTKKCFMMQRKWHNVDTEFERR